jgi:hypothetical protein
VSAAPEYFMDEQPEARAPEPHDERDADADEQSEAVFWHWFALAVLLFCWIAEASMCADRGF